MLVMPPVTGAVIMPLPAEPPARCDSGTGRVANNPARDQADRAANQSAGQRAERAIADPLLRARGAGKEQWQSQRGSQ